MKTLLGRVGIEPDLVFTGGVANNVGMWHALEELIGAKFTRSPIDMIYAGALGAAVHAGKYHAAALQVGTAKPKVVAAVGSGRGKPASRTRSRDPRPAALVRIG